MTANRQTPSHRAVLGGAAMIGAAVAVSGGVAIAQAFNADRSVYPGMLLLGPATCPIFSVASVSTHTSAGCASAMAQPRIFDECAPLRW
jgi:hypothetical protein